MTPLAQALEHNPKLEVLDFYDNNIGKKGAPHIVNSLDKLTNLKSVNFGDCMIGSKGSCEIIDKLKNLTALELLVCSFKLALTQLSGFILQ